MRVWPIFFHATTHKERPVRVLIFGRPILASEQAIRYILLQWPPVTRADSRSFRGGGHHASGSERRRAARPPADQLFSLSHFLAGRRRHVLRRLRSLCRHAPCSARRLQSKFSTLPQNAQFVSFTFLGMTIGALVDRLPRRPLRASLHLSVQPDDLRPRVAGRRVRARHDDAQRAAASSWGWGSAPRSWSATRR